MDRLWKVELAFDRNPAEVDPSEVKLYQDTMVSMVREVLLGQKEGLIEAHPVDYSIFMVHLNGLKNRRN